MSDPTPKPVRNTFPRRMRLSGRRAFTAVYEARTRVSAGPLLVYSRPNELDHPRLGLSVPRSVGTAARRNRIKRLLREAVRLMQYDWPAARRGYDLVVSVRPHEPLALAEYAALLRKAIRSMHSTWCKRQDTSQQ